MKQLLLSLALSLGLTLLLELSTALLFGQRKKALLLVALVNILTNPPVVLLLNLVAIGTQGHPPWLLIAVLELGAIAAEGLVYQRSRLLNKWNPWLFSLILNTISYLGGCLLS